MKEHDHKIRIVGRPSRVAMARYDEGELVDHILITCGPLTSQKGNGERDETPKDTTIESGEVVYAKNEGLFGPTVAVKPDGQDGYYIFSLNAIANITEATSVHEVLSSEA